MSLELTSTVGVLGLNAVFGAGLVLGVYLFIKSRIVLGAVAGLVLGAAIVVTGANLGELLFDLAYPEMRTLIPVAGLGGIAGAIDTTLMVKPDLSWHPNEAHQPNHPDTDQS